MSVRKSSVTEHGSPSLARDSLFELNDIPHIPSLYLWLRSHDADDGPVVLASVLFVIVLDQSHLVVLGRGALIGGRLRYPSRGGRRGRIRLGDSSVRKEGFIGKRKGLELRDRVGGVRSREGARRVRRSSVPKNSQSLETTVWQSTAWLSAHYSRPRLQLQLDNSPGQMVNLTWVNTLPKAFCTG
jgi:hypothetical protein